ncbi:ATP-binding cassette sub-family A member 17 [Araneus ventricosus]|uniref:ATP-binding cassette sub-family A member 17 n=1 Tax=Araneus ventricosus TaxID=182803 RepID=A0A4Y2W806_ARAVE|nr:ATP-binding cassette sub-family A member 17 [Araneus ventricosus]
MLNSNWMEYKFAIAQRLSFMKDITRLRSMADTMVARRTPDQQQTFRVLKVSVQSPCLSNVADISDVKYKAQSDHEERNGVDFELGDIREGALVLTSYRKLANQFAAQLIKRFHYSTRHWSVLIAQLAIPLLLMCLCLYSIKISSSQYRTEYDPLKMDISSVYGKTDGFYYSERPDLSGLADSLKNVLDSNKVSVQKVPEPTHFVLNYGKDITKYYKNIVVGGAIDRDPSGALNLTAWYNDQMFHSMPMALLLMHTALLQSTVNGGSISMTNAPLPQLQSGYSNDIVDQLVVAIMATVFVPLALGFLSASFTLVPIHERATKAKLLQLMSGIPAVMYWTAMFLWDYLVHCTACIFMIIPYAIFAHYAFFGKHSISTGTSLLLLFLYGWSSIPFSYLTSFVFSKGNAGFASVVGFCAVAEMREGRGGLVVRSRLRCRRVPNSKYDSKEYPPCMWDCCMLSQT